MRIKQKGAGGDCSAELKILTARRTRYRSDEDAVAVVDFMLDDLGSPATEGFDPGLEGLVLPTDFDFLITHRFSGTSQKGQASFFGFIFSFGLENFRIQHSADLIAFHENDDSHKFTDHIACHTNTAIPVKSKGIRQILQGGQICLASSAGFSGQQQRIVYQFSNHS
jgi:hypothetical protein